MTGLSTRKPPANPAHASFVSTSDGMSGWFAVLVWWNPEHGGFWEPWDTGFGRYATKAEAESEARDWAKAEGVEFYDGSPKP